MSNIAVVLREEITRLARKEIRSQTKALKKASAEYLKKIAEMKRQVSELQRKVTSLEKQVHRNIPSQVGEPDTKSSGGSSSHGQEGGSRTPGRTVQIRPVDLRLPVKKRKVNKKFDPFIMKLNSCDIQTISTTRLKWDRTWNRGLG